MNGNGIKEKMTWLSYLLIHATQTQNFIPKKGIVYRHHTSDKNHCQNGSESAARLT